MCFIIDYRFALIGWSHIGWFNTFNLRAWLARLLDFHMENNGNIAITFNEIWCAIFSGSPASNENENVSYGLRWILQISQEVFLSACFLASLKVKAASRRKFTEIKRNIFKSVWRRKFCTEWFYRNRCFF